MTSTTPWYSNMREPLVTTESLESSRFHNNLNRSGNMPARGVCMLVGSYHYALPIAISSLITSLDNEVREKALCGAVQRRNLQVGCSQHLSWERIETVCKGSPSCDITGCSQHLSWERIETALRLVDSPRSIVAPST